MSHVSHGAGGLAWSIKKEGAGECGSAGRIGPHMAPVDEAVAASVITSGIGTEAQHCQLSLPKPSENQILTREAMGMGLSLRNPVLIWVLMRTDSFRGFAAPATSVSAFLTGRWRTAFSRPNTGC